MNIRLSLFFSAFALIFCACQNAASETSVNAQNFTSAPISAPDSLIEGRADKTNVAAKHEAANVWVCKSAGAKKYHFNKDCSGLGRCKHKIEEMAKSAAEAIGLEQCSLKKCK